MSRFSALSLLLIVAFLPVPSPAEPATRSVNVTGSAASRALPDVVVWRIQLTDMHADMLQAKNKSDAKTKAVMAVRSKLGLSGQDLQLCQVQISRETDRQDRFTGFKVTRDITVRMTDMSRFDHWLSTLAGAAEMELSYSLDSSKVEALTTQARNDALAAAKRKAKLSVEALGGQLGAVQSINVQSTQSPRQHYGANTHGSGADVISGTLAPSAIEVRFTVAVSFAIN